jgi:hypothetical protein
MKTTKLLLAFAAAGMLSACAGGDLLHGPVGEDKSRDRGRDSKDLSQLRAGIWVDPNGCDHWIIDDGVEGYLDIRLDPYGKPVCSGIAPPTVATGPFKGGDTRNHGDPL